MKTAFALLLLLVAGRGVAATPQAEIESRVLPSVRIVGELVVDVCGPGWELATTTIEGDSTGETFTATWSWREANGARAGDTLEQSRTVNAFAVLVPRRIVDPAGHYEMLRDGLSGVGDLGPVCGFGERCYAYERPAPRHRFILKALSGRLLLEVNAPELQLARVFGREIERAFLLAGGMDIAAATINPATIAAGMESSNGPRVQQFEKQASGAPRGWSLASSVSSLHPLRGDWVVSQSWASKPGAAFADKAGIEKHIVAMVSFVFYRLDVEAARRQFEADCLGGRGEGRPTKGLGDLAFERQWGRYAVVEILVGTGSVRVAGLDSQAVRELASFAVNALQDGRGR